MKNQEALSALISNSIVNDFMASTKIPKSRAVKDIITYMASAESVNAMIVASKLGMPALAGILSELEKRFADNPEFPLNHDGAHANSANRRSIGWMVRFVMKYYGYTPEGKGRISTKIPLEGRTEETRESYFATSAIYKKTGDAKYQIVVGSDVC